MIRLHHVNLSWVDVPAMAAFYEKVLGLPRDESMSSMLLGEMRDADAAFLDGGGTGLHLSPIDHGVPYRHNQSLNPVDRGHIAFRTDDLDAVKAALRANGVPFADYGVWSVAGWNQIFFQDPAGTVVEVHQLEEEPGPQA